MPEKRMLPKKVEKSKNNSNNKTHPNTAQLACLTLRERYWRNSSHN
jgi:hypothetical protein